MIPYPRVTFVYYRLSEADHPCVGYIRMASAIAQAQRLASKHGAGAFASRLSQHLARVRPLNAFIDERILEPDQGGALSGVPIAIKANLCVEGTLTTAASKILEGHRPSYTATAVERLRAAGATIVGSTNMDEFGMGSSTAFSAHGPTLNPYSLAFAGEQATASDWLTPGGSSGGSAVAVATGAVAVALGSDTGGSVRQPAAFCGIVGFKPSYGRISRHGLIAYASSLDTVGVLARSVGDAALLYDVVAGPDAADDTCIRESGGGIALGGPCHDYALRRLTALPGERRSSSDGWPLRAALAASDLSGLRVGCPAELRVLPRISPDVIEAWDAAAASLRARGAQVYDVSLPALRGALSAYYVIAAAEAASNLSRYDGLRYGASSEEFGAAAALSFREAVEQRRSRLLGPEVQRRIMVGSLVLSREGRGAYYTAAEAARARLVADFARVFAGGDGGGVDVLLAPVSPVLPWPSSAASQLDPALLYEADAMTVPASLAGLPAIAVPVGLSSAGPGGAAEPVPVAVQLVGRLRDEDTVLAVAAVLEAAVAFPAPPWRLEFS